MVDPANEDGGAEKGVARNMCKIACFPVPSKMCYLLQTCTCATMHSTAVPCILVWHSFKNATHGNLFACFTLIGQSIEKHRHAQKSMCVCSNVPPGVPQDCRIPKGALTKIRLRNTDINNKKTKL